MLDEVLEGLAVEPAGLYVDGTYGRGGHARSILARLGGEGALVVFDRDPAAIRHAHDELGSDARVRIVHAPFDEMGAHVAAGTASGVLFDLGVSSPQLDEPARGFSFLRDGPLDMRMDTSRGPSCADFVATGTEAEMASVIATYGEERFARRIARAIVEVRAASPLVTTGQLAAVVAGAIPMRSREPGKHPATRTFQALRIHINQELAFLERGLDAALNALAVGGRIVVISFHSLEDRIVKRFLRQHSQEDPVWRGMPNAPIEAQPRLELLSRAIHASDREIEENVRARSAVLRIARKVRA
jgi:16S rRNA (cytosine1402-N4)-methyltransferase